jgi:hypothetical protein
LPQPIAKRVLLCGYYGEHNLGDDALLQVALGQLPTGVMSTVTAFDEAQVQERFGVSTVPRRSLRQVLHALKGVDALVLGGGSLLQDIGTQRPEALDHRQAGKYEQHFHRVRFVPGSHLAGLYPGLETATTNSIHHQGIKDLAEGFVVEARCPDDGMVEAIRRSGPGFVAGVQWHPEFHRPDDPTTLDDSPILQDFLRAARAARARPR